MKKIVKIFGFAISKEDKEGLVWIKNEPSTPQTNGFVCLVNKFVEKYGLYPYKNHPDDDTLIKECPGVTLIPKKQI